MTAASRGLDRPVNSREDRWHPYNRRIDILLLCTANQCRSPMAEVLLRHQLAARGVDATVSSAGLMPGGRPATGHGQATMASRGLDLSGHRSRRVDGPLIAAADLIIGMAREHIREVAVLDGPALAKAFTLKELIRLATAIGPRRDDEPLADWLGRAAAGRSREALLGAVHDDAYDVEDPVGRGRADYTDTAAEIDHLLERLVALAWPAHDRATTGSAS